MKKYLITVQDDNSNLVFKGVIHAEETNFDNYEVEITLKEKIKRKILCEEGTNFDKLKRTLNKIDNEKSYKFVEL